jgi:hypothetical protein
MTKRGTFSVEFIRCVAERKIKALVIGRQAMAVYGAPTATNDLDLLVVAERDELRLCELAAEFDLVKVLEETGGILYRKRQVRFSDESTAQTSWPRVLDILTIPRLRGFSFEEAWKRRVPIRLPGCGTFHIPHVDDLITLKRARGIPRDKEDIAWMRRNRDELLKAFPSVQ